MKRHNKNNLIAVVLLVVILSVVLLLSDNTFLNISGYFGNTYQNVYVMTYNYPSVSPQSTTLHYWFHKAGSSTIISSGVCNTKIGTLSIGSHYNFSQVDIYPANSSMPSNVYNKIVGKYYGLHSAKNIAYCSIGLPMPSNPND